MQAIIQAVVAQIVASAALAQLLGGVPQVFITQAPEGVELPVLTISRVEQLTEHAFGAAACQTVDIDLTLAAASMEQTLSLGDALASLFDGAVFALSSGALLLLCEQTGASRLGLAAHNSQNLEVYQTTISLRLIAYQPPAS